VKEEELTIVSKNKIGRFRNGFFQEQGNEVVVHCFFMEKTFFGFRLLDLRSFAFKFTVQNVVHTFNGGTDGKD
jgi:hypothetical protein